MEVGNVKIAIASGKGGTGKTTVAVNLAYFLSRSHQNVQYIDCDVEEPNGHIFLKPEIRERVTSNVMVPAIDMNKCTFCGECGAKCQFHAIANLPSDTLLFPELCHGCGLCSLVCPERAIGEEVRGIGIIEEGAGIENIEFVHGILRIGEPMAVPLIRMVKRRERNGYTRIIDAPPGTSCPVVATLSDADVVIMVAEPTPFGLHDLKIAVAVTEQLGIPLGIVINRDEGDFPPLAKYLKGHNLVLLTKIPDDREVAEHYSEGSIILKTLPRYLENYAELMDNMRLLLDSPLKTVATWQK